MTIEIGTSDFRTEAGKVEGLFIEPVKEHFDRLPKCNKENIAISNVEGEMEIYYIPSFRIKSENLPNWVRGCNSVGHPHPTLIQMGWGDYIGFDKVKVERIKTVLERHNITEVDFLKIDTEGHDCVILNDWLDTVTIKPTKIQFESNVLSNPDDVIQMIKRLNKIGYKCKVVNFDVICTL